MTEQIDPKKPSSDTKQSATAKSIALVLAVFSMSIYLMFSFGMSVNAIVKDTRYQNTYDAEAIGKYVTLIGDSISYMSQEELRETLPGVDLEAVGGIQFANYSDWAGESGMARIKKHALREVVVFLLGSNEGVTEAELDAFYRYVGEDHKIVLMTIYRGNRLADTLRWNEAIKQFASSHDNVYLMDWYSENAADPTVHLMSDKLHPIESGQQRFAELVRQSILQALDISE